MKCLVCSSNNFKRTVYGGFKFLENDYYYFCCQECQFVQIDPVPSDEEIRLLYNNNYFQDYYIRGSNGIGYASHKKQAVKNARKFLHYLHNFKKNGLLLDAGCAGGYFILAANEFGLDSIGIEQNHEMAVFAVNKLHLSVSCSNTTRCFKSGIFDIIHYGDVLNNLNKPDLFIEDSIRTLKSGGILAIEGSMAFNSTFSGMILRYVHTFKNNPFDWMTNGLPYELWQFNNSNIVRYFQKFNLEVLDLKIFEDPPRAFSIERELNGRISAKFIGNSILKTLSSKIDSLPLKFFRRRGDRYWLIAQKK